MGRNATRAALFALGFISVSAQIYLLREGFTVFYGNELVFGIMLALWMLLTGAGAWLGRYSRRLKGMPVFLLFLMLLLAALPLLMTVKLQLYRALVLPAGTMAGISDVLYASFLVQLPFCLINGFLFTSLSLMLGDSGKAYSTESAGSLLAGAVVNFVLLWVLPSRISLLLVSGAYLAFVVFYSFSLGKRFIPWITVAFSALLILFLSGLETERLSGAALYPSQEVKENIESPYGQITLTTSGSQLNVYANGLLLSSSGDEINNEENVHYAMLQRTSPKNILLLGGGYSGAISEILKYHPLRVDYVELNPSLLKIGASSLKDLEKQSVYLHSGDARRFVQNSSAVYDIVLVVLPPPSSLQLNRMYSVEFLQLLKPRLSPDGIVLYSLPTTSDYVSKAGEDLNSVMYATLKSAFRNVLIVPGGKTFFLASDGWLSIGFPALSEKQGISTLYVNKYYLDSVQMKERSEYIRSSMKTGAGVNRDFRPLMFFAQLKYWMSYFDRHLMLALVIGAALLILALLNLNPVNAGLFAGGLTAGAFQVIMLLALQVWFGYVFQLTGFVIMLFMGGVVAGSRIGQSASSIGKYFRLQLWMAVISLAVPLIILFSPGLGLPSWLLIVFAGMVVLVSGYITGRAYALASLLGEGAQVSSVSKNYSADLFGSAFGAFLVPVFLFPVLGLAGTGVLLFLVNICGALWLWSARRNFVPL